MGVLGLLRGVVCGIPKGVALGDPSGVVKGVLCWVGVLRKYAPIKEDPIMVFM